MNFFNKVVIFFSKLKNRAMDKLDITIPNLTGLSKNPVKYLFYAITIVLPLIAFLLFKNLKIFTIILISYCTFLKYLNVCVFQKLCILNNKNKKCKLVMKDLKEALTIGLGSFFFLWLSKTIFRLFSGKKSEKN